MDAAVAPYPRRSPFYFSPLKVYEYMAAGLPVVASRIGQLTELLEDGGCGVLCPPGDAGALADASPAAARSRAAPPARRRARTKILREATWDGVACRLLAVLERCRGRSTPNHDLREEVLSDFDPYPGAAAMGAWESAPLGGADVRNASRADSFDLSFDWDAARIPGRNSSRQLFTTKGRPGRSSLRIPPSPWLSMRSIRRRRWRPPPRRARDLAAAAPGGAPRANRQDDHPSWLQPFTFAVSPRRVREQHQP